MPRFAFFDSISTFTNDTVYLQITINRFKDQNNNGCQTL